MRRRNHLLDALEGCRYVASWCKTICCYQRLNVHRSVIHRLWTIAKGIKAPVEDVGLNAVESPQRQTIATCCNVPDAGGH
ncbi:hypothetical protein AVEN_237168-1 [Araneus ventricosus]|uniref:Uncharacterized protein n=1 Tax=Araneus ventricosus TaxID=182803 RepID=A0A4Y2H1G7_ARAVE|nr:hypothetical protein AVEN_62376-1 [Araneus ventricosus]GBO07585.1 hypothetical protein AVEN_237168-1 [Araneus ventricosus]